MISKRTSRAYVTHSDEAPAYWMVGILWRVLVTSVQSGNSLALLDQVCSTGSGPRRHTHFTDEGLYVAKGRVTFNAGGEELVAGAGDYVTVPRHTEHSFLVEEEAVLINFYFPAGFDLWLMGMAVPAQRNELPTDDTPMPPHGLVERLFHDYSGTLIEPERTTSPNPDAAARPTLSSRRTVEALWYGRGCWSVLADADSTGGSSSVFEALLGQGLVDAPHVHDFTDEAYYLLEGDAEIFVDDAVHTLRRGSLAFVPRGHVHAVRVLGESARFLVLHTTPGYERILRASGTPVGDVALPPAGWQPDGGATPQQVADVQADLGLRPIVVPSAFQTA